MGTTGIRPLSIIVSRSPKILHIPMRAHHHTGRQGEALAEHWLRLRGHEILDRNWRFGHLELDIVTMHEGRLHVVEVKTKRGGSDVRPEEEVRPTKLRRLLKAAGAYVRLKGVKCPMRIDVLAIRLDLDGDIEFFLIEDVYM